jgi:hypothetical protein
LRARSFGFALGFGFRFQAGLLIRVALGLRLRILARLLFGFALGFGFRFQAGLLFRVALGLRLRLLARLLFGCALGFCFRLLARLLFFRFALGLGFRLLARLLFFRFALRLGFRLLARLLFFRFTLRLGFRLLPGLLFGFALRLGFRFLARLLRRQALFFGAASRLDLRSTDDRAAVLGTRGAAQLRDLAAREVHVKPLREAFEVMLDVGDIGAVAYAAPQLLVQVSAPVRPLVAGAGTSLQLRDAALGKVDIQALRETLDVHLELVGVVAVLHAAPEFLVDVPAA